MKTPRPTSFSPAALLSILNNEARIHCLRRQLPSRWIATPRNQSFSTTSVKHANSRVLNPLRTPPQFHDTLRLIAANNTLLLALFTTSACAPCSTITPLLSSLVETRPSHPQDKFSSMSFVEVELDSPDTSNGNMMDLGVEYGVTSMPTLMGFGGRRAERCTERLVDVRLLSDANGMAKWLDEEMKKGDKFAAGGTGSGGLLGKIFGG